MILEFLLPIFSFNHGTLTRWVIEIITTLFTNNYKFQLNILSLLFNYLTITNAEMSIY